MKITNSEYGIFIMFEEKLSDDEVILLKQIKQKIESEFETSLTISKRAIISRFSIIEKQADFLNRISLLDVIQNKKFDIVASHEEEIELENVNREGFLKAFSNNPLDNDHEILLLRNKFIFSDTLNDYCCIVEISVSGKNNISIEATDYIKLDSNLIKVFSDLKSSSQKIINSVDK